MFAVFLSPTLFNATLTYCQILTINETAVFTLKEPGHKFFASTKNGSGLCCRKQHTTISAVL